MNLPLQGPIDADAKQAAPYVPTETLKVQHVSQKDQKEKVKKPKPVTSEEVNRIEAFEPRQDKFTPRHESKPSSAVQSPLYSERPYNFPDLLAQHFLGNQPSVPTLPIV